MTKGTRLLVVANLAVLATIVGIGGYELWQARDDRERSASHLQRLTAMVESAQGELQRVLEGVAERSRLAQEEPGVSLEGLSASLQARLEALIASSQGSVAQPTAVVAGPVTATAGDVDGEFAGLEPAAQPASSPPSAVAAGLDTERELQQVHFLFDSHELTPSGKRKILLAAKDIVTGSPSRVRILGFSDSLGDSGYNARLSRRRAESVAASLLAAGVPADLVEIIGHGENDLPEPTEDGVAEPLNRCVAIVAMP
jgi:outer membrane protein OmpA-like peptidoglycan-associated protein